MPLAPSRRSASAEGPLGRMTKADGEKWRRVAQAPRCPGTRVLQLTDYYRRDEGVRFITWSLV